MGGDKSCVLQSLQRTEVRGTGPKVTGTDVIPAVNREEEMGTCETGGCLRQQFFVHDCSAQQLILEQQAVEHCLGNPKHAPIPNCTERIKRKASSLFIRVNVRALKQVYLWISPLRQSPTGWPHGPPIRGYGG